MPKPSDTPGNGNGGGGGDGGGDNTTVAFEILGLDSASDTGTFNDDDLTQLTTGLTITGTLDSTIEYVDFWITLTLSDGTVRTFSVLDDDDTNDAWSFKVTGDSWTFSYTGADLPDGTVQVDAAYKTMHKNGKTEQTTSAGSYSFEIDSSTPPPEITSVTPDGDDLVLSGTAEAGAEVTIIRDGTERGTVTADGSGNWTFTDSGAAGTSATYTAEAVDLAGNTALTTEGYAYSPSTANTDPVAGDDTATTDEDNAVVISVLGNDSDSDGDTLSISGVSNASDGAVQINADGTSITYTPADDWHGTDSFTYTISDGNGGTDTATVTVTVASVNDAPVAENDSATTDEDNAVTVSVLGNDSDVENDTLSVQSATNGANGTVTVNADGTLTYTPDADFNGTDSFTYTVSDGNGGTDNATVTVTVNPVNDAPVASADTVSTDEDTPVGGNVLTNDNDVDGDTLSVTGFVVNGTGYAAGQTAILDEGELTLNADGTWSFVPAADYHGPVPQVTYTVSDGTLTDTATLDITVAAVNDAPDAVDDSASTDEDVTVNGNVLGNDSDVEGDSLTVAGFSANGTDYVAGATASLAEGQLTINADGSWTFVPAADYNGAGPSVTYTVTDGSDTSTAGLSITVNPVNDDPEAGDDAVTTEQDRAVTIAVLANDSDVDGDTLDIIGTTTPANGSIEVNADGTITYTPNAGYLGDDSFSYTISDGQGGTATATVTVSVEAPSETATFTPDDPLYAEQWHLAMLGDIKTIWAEYSGAGVSVGVYDDGIEYDHVDLDDNYDASKHLSYDGSVLDPYPTTDSEAVHGTAVAGVIAAEANGVGTVGVAWGAMLTGVNIFSGPADINASDKSGFYAASDEQWQFAVVNHSWGSAPVYLNDVSEPTLSILEDWEYALANGRDGRGTIVVKAAGNDGDSAQGDFLNAVRYSITVGAYDWENDASWYTNRGANVLVSAPSSGKTVYDGETGELTADSDLRIATTDRNGEFGYADDAWSSSYDISGFGGTSSASPVVSGVAALMLEANPDLGWRDVQTILAYSAHHVGSEIGGGPYSETETVPERWLVPGGSDDMITVPVEYFDWFWNGADNWNGGGLHFSEDYGFGSVDAYNAVRMAEVWSLFGPAQDSTNEASASTGTMSPNLGVSGAGDTATYQFTYSGGAMNLEYVDIAIVLNTELMQEVALEITSPEGTTITLLDVPINDFTPAYEFLGLFLARVDVSWTFGAHAFKGEDPNGTWTVTLTEKDVTFDVDNYGRESDGNTITSLGMTFYGQTGASLADDVYHYTSEMLSLELAADDDRRILDDASGEDWLNMAAMPADLVVDLAGDGSGEARVAGGTTFVEIAAGTLIEHAVTGDGDDSLTGNDGANKLYGMRGNDMLLGLGGDDVLAGGQGDDQYWGGAGDDVFEFHAGDGADWIWDFVAGAASDDQIALYGTGFMTFDDLDDIFADSGGNAVIDFGNGDSITFAGLSSAELNQDDFLFYA